VLRRFDLRVRTFGFWWCKDRLCRFSITSANLFCRERKPFFSRGEAFFIVRKKLRAPTFRVVNDDVQRYKMEMLYVENQLAASLKKTEA